VPATVVEATVMESDELPAPVMVEGVKARVTPVG